MIRVLPMYMSIVFATVRALFRSRREQARVELALRQQLATYAHPQTKPRWTPRGRTFWVALSRIWPRWKKGLCIVQPETGVRWRRKGFALLLAVDLEARARPACDFPGTTGTHSATRWTFSSSRRLASECATGGSSSSTVAGQLCCPSATASPRRRILHVHVTAHPTSSWTIQQLGETFPDEHSLPFLIHDNDTLFSDRVVEAIAHLGIKSRRTAYRSPWQNGIAERWVGTVRRERLDNGIVMDERHLRRLLREYVEYYNNEDRVHTCLRDSPIGRSAENRPSADAKMVGLPRVAGLHHRYAWREAA